jgi:hypothetical protein
LIQVRNVQISALELTSGHIARDFDVGRGLAAKHFQTTLAAPRGNGVNKHGWWMTDSEVPWPGMFPSPPIYLVPLPLISTRSIQFTPVERTLASWIKKSQISPVDSAIEERARHFAEMTENDEASLMINAPGWLERFKQECGFSTSSSSSSANKEELLEEGATREDAVGI